LHIPYDISIDWDNINISLLFVTLLNNNGYTFPKIYKNGYSVWNIQIYETRHARWESHVDITC
jgi:hypothetical protein